MRRPSAVSPASAPGAGAPAPGANGGRGLRKRRGTCLRRLDGARVIRQHGRGPLFCRRLRHNLRLCAVGRALRIVLGFLLGHGTSSSPRSHYLGLPAYRDMPRPPRRLACAQGQLLLPAPTPACRHSVDSVLHDLGRPAGEALGARNQVLAREDLVGDGDHLEPAHLREVLERQAALLRLIRLRAALDLGVEHDGNAVAVAIGDDGLDGADLVRREAHGILERGERVAQVLDDLRVGRRGLLGRLAQKLTVLDDLLDHGSLPLDARGAGRSVSVRST